MAFVDKFSFRGYEQVFPALAPVALSLSLALSGCGADQGLVLDHFSQARPDTGSLPVGPANGWTGPDGRPILNTAPEAVQPSVQSSESLPAVQTHTEIIRRVYPQMEGWSLHGQGQVYSRGGDTLRWYNFTEAKVEEAAFEDLLGYFRDIAQLGLSAQVETNLGVVSFRVGAPTQAIGIDFLSFLRRRLIRGVYMKVG